jgi:hypothetical protein
MGIIPQMSTNYPRGRGRRYEDKGFVATGVEHEDEIELVLTIF